MAKYSIEDTTLTALGDAVRGKVGDTKTVLVDTVLLEGEIERNKLIKYYFPTGTRKVEVKSLGNDTGSTVIMDASGNIWHDLGSTFNYRDTWSASSNIGDGYYFQHMSYSDGVNYRGYEFTCYDAEGNILQGEQPVKNTMTPIEMAEALEDMPVLPPESSFAITGDCKYKFSYGGWDWFIEQYGDRITTKDITSAQCMFQQSDLTFIPFDINGSTDNNFSCSNLFSNCENLVEISKITGIVDNTTYMFAYCRNLREISEEAVAGIDWSFFDNLTSSYSGARSNMFANCYSLRKYPTSLLAHGNPVITYSNSIYTSLFDHCYALDEIVDLPVIHRNAKWTSNAFKNTFKDCNRLKRLTFETNEDGSPIVISGWSKQTIDLSSVGYTAQGNSSRFTNYNSGLTTETQINDAETYEALKNNPDSWTTNFSYSRYNHDSAVETINTLPDLSGGAGNNSIIFASFAGELTDGGAAAILTEEEIAVATAKGWTVSLT